MMLTNDPKMAAEADAAGADRVFVDLEYINKRERQMGRDTHIATSSIEDVARVRDVLKSAELLVRVNPMNANSDYEIERVIRSGASIVMLPMVVDRTEVNSFVSQVNRRARTCLLLETAQSLARLDAIATAPGVDEIYIGLNDLHLSMHLDFMFELLSGGIVEYMASRIVSHGLPFGFGGIARIGEGALPAEQILGEHIRLGSSSVILSRAFRNGIQGSQLEREIVRIRDEEARIRNWSEADFELNRIDILRRVANMTKQ